LAQLGGRDVLGLGINLFGLGLSLLCFGLSIVLGFSKGLGFFAFTLVLGTLDPLALVTSLAGSFRCLRKGEISLDSQGCTEDSRAVAEGDERAIRTS